MRPRHTVRIAFINEDSPTAINRAPLDLHFGEGVSREIIAGFASRLEFADEVKSVRIVWKGAEA